MAEPALSIVVSTTDRSRRSSEVRVLRLRWLLNALQAQTLERSLWEAIVCHASSDAGAEKLLSEHPLAHAGVLRRASPPGTLPSQGALRNAGIRLARAPVIVFTEDECRPPEDWLQQVLSAVGVHPGAIVQGPIDVDPAEWRLRRAPYPRTKSFTRVPRPCGDCCNIVYPRELLERIGGFDELLGVGEDTDLILRARRAGTSYIGEPEMATYHAIEEAGLRWWIGSSWRLRGLATLPRRHPQLRRELPLGLFWKQSHAWFGLALAGVGLARRNPLWSLLAIPWSVERGRGERLIGRVRDLLELPGWALVDCAEMLSLAVGSARHRTILL